MPTHKVFVYGTLKRGYHNHRLLKHATYLGTAMLTKPHVLLDAGFPVCVPLHTGVAQVTGEVYAVDEDTLSNLDCLEGNGRMYHRRKRKVVYDVPLDPCGNLVSRNDPDYQDAKVGNAWVYLGDRKYWRNHAPVGAQWCKRGTFVYNSKRYAEEEVA